MPYIHKDQCTTSHRIISGSRDLKGQVGEKLKVELLYFAGCPNYPPALRVLTDVLKECGVEEEIAEIHVRDLHQANALAFPGSPTIRINDTDVEAEPHPIQSFGMTCRSYLVNGKRQGVPPAEWIHKAVLANLEKN
jgi:hypothetical protein